MYIKILNVCTYENSARTDHFCQKSYFRDITLIISQIYTTSTTMKIRLKTRKNQLTKILFTWKLLRGGNFRVFFFFVAKIPPNENKTHTQEKYRENYPMWISCQYFAKFPPQRKITTITVMYSSVRFIFRDGGNISWILQRLTLQF